MSKRSVRATILDGLGQIVDPTNPLTVDTPPELANDGVRDVRSVELLEQILVQLRMMNIQLNTLTDNELVETDLDGELQ